MAFQKLPENGLVQHGAITARVMKDGTVNDGHGTKAQSHEGVQ